jgi:biotin carboxyl carrier protein
MVKKGYLTVTQAQGEQSKLESLQINLAKALEDKRVLTDPVFGTGKRQNTFLQNNVMEAKRALERVKSQAAAREAQARSAREAKKSVHQQEVIKCKEIDDEIKKCKIYSPQEGMVVYYIPEQARYGGGAQQSIVAQGEPVREGQKLMQIPNLRRMLVNTRVHEALVSRVTSGQPAIIRVDSFPDRVLHGHVDQVATVSSQADFYSSDVKVYTTKVRITDSVESLKPGMSAEVTITVGATLEHALTVPIQAIIGSAEMGKKRKCFVVTEQGPQEREILVGQSNERMAEIREGVREGEEVVLNPKVLVGDKVKTRQPSGNRKGESGDDNPESDGKSPSPKGKDRPKSPMVPEKRPVAVKDGKPMLDPMEGAPGTGSPRHNANNSNGK